jgi:4-hydroxythreonine-4-phosphate dehydrogenase
MAPSLPRLALTLGDPSGIGTEVILKALADSAIAQQCQITLVGTRSLLQQSYLRLQQQGLEVADPEKFPLLDISLDKDTQDQLRLGQGNWASGAASFAYLEAAIAKTLLGKFQGIVTAPIAKSAWKEAGYDFPGQTEVLAERSQVKKFGMLFVARSPYTGWTMRTLLATTHIPLKQVPTSLTPELMSLKLDLLVQTLQDDFAITHPTIAIAGLNPHSGEQGQIGTEERDWLIPWLEQACQHFPKVKLIGPVPPDTLWVRPGQAWFNDGNIQAADGYLALYHDQGLIPVKLMAFDQAINTTIGLPFIRTSPDHGTAFDIATQGIARADSMKAAITLAAELAQSRFCN